MADTSPTQDRLAVANFILKVLGLVLLVFVAIVIKKPLIDRLSTNLQEVEAFGVRFSFVADQVEETFWEAAENDPGRWGDPNVAIPSIKNRLELVGSAVAGTRVLWVAPRPTVTASPTARRSCFTRYSMWRKDVWTGDVRLD